MRSLGTIILEQEKSKKQKEYEDFFKGKLGEYGVESPAELSTEDKKKFFNEIESEWTGDTNEMVAPIEEDPGADVDGGVKAEGGGENGGGAGKPEVEEKGDGDAASDAIEDAENKAGEPTTSGEGDAVVTDDQKITAAVKEALAELVVNEGGDVKLLVRKLDSLVGTTMKKIAKELADKGFSAEEVKTYMDALLTQWVNKKTIN